MLSREPNRYLGAHLAIGALVVVAGSWAFGSLVDAVLDAATVVKIDVAANRWMYAHTTPLGVRIATALSWIGSPPTMLVLCIVGALLLWRFKERLLLATWGAAFLGGNGIGFVVKHIVHRSRPPLAAGHAYDQTLSFPSGHSLGAFLGFGMVAFVIEELWHSHRVAKVVIQVAAALLVVAIGASRLYLGVHYPTDVAGGFAVGATWLAVCVTGAVFARQRRR
jgi:membrane-associated phospholipid phosphatase